MIKNSLSFKLSAWFVLGCFCSQTILVDANAATVVISGPAQAASEVQHFETAFHNLPPEIGKLSGKWIASQNQNKPFVIHVQDAHANADAQKNIFRILRYLEKEFPGMRLGLENTEGKLHPEYFEFFKDAPQADAAMMRALTESGELTGAELFLWKKMKEGRRGMGLEVQGVENRDLHRANVEQYREMLAGQPEARNLLLPLHEKLLSLASQKMSPELAVFARERERRREGRFENGKPIQSPDLSAYVKYLNQQAVDRLGFDLTDPNQQFDFPHLARLIRLAQVQKNLNPEKARTEWKQLVDVLSSKKLAEADRRWLQAFHWVGYHHGFLQEKTVRPLLAGFSDGLLPRFVFEDALRVMNAHQVDYALYADWIQSMKQIIFAAEIEVQGLIREMDTVEDRLIQSLAATEDDRKWIQKLEEFNRFQKLLYLEIDRADYEEILAAPQTYRAIAAVHPRLQEAFQKADQFYQTAHEREQVMVTNLMKLAAPAAARSEVLKSDSNAAVNSPQAVVLISGGFHSEGIQKLLQEKQISYATLTPSIREVRAGQYENVMGGVNEDLSAWFGKTAPFQGGAAVLFREFLRTGVPAYLKQEAGSAEGISAALKGHALLSRPYDYKVQSKKGRLQLQMDSRTANFALPNNAAVFRPHLASEGTLASVAFGRTELNASIDLGVESAAPERVEPQVELPRMRSELRLGVSSIGGAAVHGRIVFQSLHEFVFDDLITVEENARAEQEFSQWIERVKQSAKRYLSAPLWEKVEGVAIQGAARLSKEDFNDHQLHHPIARYIAGVNREIKSLQAKLDQKPSASKRNELQARMEALLRFMEVLEVEARLWRLYKIHPPESTRVSAADSAENAESVEVSSEAAEEVSKLEPAYDIYEMARQKVIRERVEANRVELEGYEATSRILKKLIERNVEALERDIQTELELLRALPEFAVYREKLEKAFADFLHRKAEAMLGEKVDDEARLNQAEVDRRVEDTDYKKRWQVDERVSLFLVSYQTLIKLRNEEAGKKGKATKKSTAAGSKESTSLEDLFSQLDSVKASIVLIHAYEEYLKYPEAFKGLDEQWNSEEDGALLWVAQMKNMFSAKAQKIKDKYPDQNFPSTSRDTAEWQSSLPDEDPRKKDLSSYGFNLKMVETFEDTEGYLRRVLLGMLGEAERQILDSSAAERKPEVADDGEMEDLGLFVTRNVTVEEIDRDLEKYQGRVKFIVTTVGGRNTHWVNLLRGRRDAPEIIFLDASKYQKEIDELKSGDLAVTLSGREGLELHIRPDEAIQKRANAEFREQETERSMRRRIAPDVTNDVFLNLEATASEIPTEDHPAGTGLVRADFVSEEVLEAWKRLVGQAGEAERLESSLRQAWNQPQDPSAWLDAVEKRLGTSYGRNVSHLFLQLKKEYEPLLKQGFFQGRDYSLRTMDLQNDSKNQEAYQTLVQAYGRKDITGFDFYRNTDLGRIHQILQIAVLFAVYAENFDGKPASERPQLNIFPPMVASQDDINFFFNEILPSAKAFAANWLGMAAAGNPENQQAVQAKVERIAAQARYGVMVEIPELITDPELRRAIIQDPRVSFYSMGTNDLELLFWRKTLGEGEHLNRESPASEFVFGKLHPEMMKAIHDFVADIKTHAPGKVVKFCGAMAAREELGALIAQWRHEGVNAYSSVNGADLARVRTGGMLFSSERMKDALRVFNQMIAGGTLNEDRLADAFSTVVLENPEYKKNRETLLMVERWQQHYVSSGGLGSLQHLDLDVVEGVGSAIEFQTLVKIAQLHGWAPASFNSRFDVQKEKLLNRLVAENLIYEEEKRELLEAWKFLSHVREMYLKLRKEDVAYAGDLHPELLPEFLKYLEPLGINSADEFYNQYFMHARAVFESSTRILHDVMSEILKPSRLEYEPAELSAIPVAAQELLKQFPQIKIRKRHGMTFSTETGFNYREYEAIYFEDEGRNEKTLDSELISSIFELSAITGFRISHRTQKKLRQVTRVPLNNGVRLKNILSVPRSVAYPVARAHRFQVLDRLFSGYDSGHDRFEAGEHPFSDYTLMLRAFEFMELLPEMENYVYSRVRATYEKIRAEPDNVFILRSAVLINHLVVDAVRGLPLNQTQKRWEKMSAAVEDLLRKISPAWGRADAQREVIRRITWLIYHQAFLSQHDFLTPGEIQGALKNILLSSGFKSHTGDEITPFLLDMLYVMSYSMRAGEIEDEKKELILRSGPDSRFANLDKLFIAGRQALNGRFDPKRPELLEQALDAADRSVRGEVSSAARSADSTWEGVTVPANGNEGVNAQVLASAWAEYSAAQGFKREDIEKISSVLSNSAIVADYYKRYQKLLTPYYLSTLTHRQMAEQLVFFIHLDLLAKEKRFDQVPYLATRISHPYNTAFELHFGLPHDHRGTLNAITRVLFENGFHLEALTFHFEPGTQQGFVRVLGYVPHEVRKPEALIRKIYRDSKEIFSEASLSAGEISSYFAARFWGEASTRVGLIQDRLVKKYGSLKIPEVQSTWRGKTASVQWMDGHHLVIQATDRFGLTVAAAEILSNGFELVVDDIVLDDFHGRVPRLFLELSKQNKREITAEEKLEISEVLERMLSYPGAFQISNGKWTPIESRARGSQPSAKSDLKADLGQQRSEMRVKVGLGEGSFFRRPLSEIYAIEGENGEIYQILASGSETYAIFEKGTQGGWIQKGSLSRENSTVLLKGVRVWVNFPQDQLEPVFTISGQSKQVYFWSTFHKLPTEGENVVWTFVGGARPEYAVMESLKVLLSLGRDKNSPIYEITRNPQSGEIHLQKYRQGAALGELLRLSPQTTSVAIIGGQVNSAVRSADPTVAWISENLQEMGSAIVSVDFKNNQIVLRNQGNPNFSVLAYDPEQKTTGNEKVKPTRIRILQERSPEDSDAVSSSQRPAGFMPTDIYNQLRKVPDDEAPTAEAPVQPERSEMRSEGESGLILTPELVLSLYENGTLTSRAVASNFLSLGFNPTDLDAGLEAVGQNVIERHLQEGTLRLIAQGSQSKVYSAIIGGSVMVVKEVGEGDGPDDRPREKYEILQDVLGGQVAGYMILKNLRIRTIEGERTIEFAVVQEKVEPLDARIERIKKEALSSEERRREINVLLGQYLDLMEEIFKRGFGMKPNGFLVDVGVDKNGSVVVLDVGDILNLPEYFRSYENSGFLDSMFSEASLTTYVREHVDGEKDPRWVKKAGFIFPKKFLNPESAEGGVLIPGNNNLAEEMDRLGRLDEIDFSVYSSLQGANARFSHAQINSWAQEAFQLPVNKREVYFGDETIRDKIRKARLSYLRGIISRSEMRELQEKFHSVLIVDDELGSRESLYWSLKDKHFESGRIFKAESAEAALEVLEQHPEIKLVISDNVMTGMDGAQLAEEIDRGFTDVQAFLLVTASKGSQDQPQLNLPRLQSQILGKPFDIKTELIPAIQELAARSENQVPRQDFEGAYSLPLLMMEIYNAIPHHYRKDIESISESLMKFLFEIGWIVHTPWNAEENVRVAVLNPEGTEHTEVIAATKYDGAILNTTIHAAVFAALELLPQDELDIYHGVYWNPQAGLPFYLTTFEISHNGKPLELNDGIKAKIKSAVEQAVQKGLAEQKQLGAARTLPSTRDQVAVARGEFNLNLLRKVLVNHFGTYWPNLFSYMMRELPFEHVAAITVTPKRLLQLFIDIDEMVKEFVSSGFNSTQVKIYNPQGVDHTEIIVVAKNDRDLHERLSKMFGSLFGREAILQDYGSVDVRNNIPIYFHVFEVAQNGHALSSPEQLILLKKNIMSIAGRSESREPRRLKNILVAEDEPTVGSLVKRALEMPAFGGFQVTWVKDGAAALALLESGFVPDAILSDIIMPKMTGIEFVRKATENNPALSGIAVVFMSGWTGNANRELDELINSLRAKGHIVPPLMEKPFGLDVLKKVFVQVKEEFEKTTEPSEMRDLPDAFADNVGMALADPTAPSGVPMTSAPAPRDRSEQRSPDAERILDAIQNHPETYSGPVTNEISGMHGPVIEEILTGVLEVLEKEKGQIDENTRWTAARPIHRLIKQEPSLAQKYFERIMNLLIDDDLLVRREIEQAMLSCARSGVNMAQVKIGTQSAEIAFFRIIQKGGEKELFKADDYAMHLLDAYSNALKKGWERPISTPPQPTSQGESFAAPIPIVVPQTTPSRFSRVMVVENEKDEHLHTAPMAKIADLAAYVREKLGLDIFMRGENISEETGTLSIMVASLVNGAGVPVEVKPSPGRTIPADSVVMALLVLWESFLKDGDAYDVKREGWQVHFDDYKTKINELAKRSEMRLGYAATSSSFESIAKAAELLDRVFSVPAATVRGIQNTRVRIESWLAERHIERAINTGRAGIDQLFGQKVPAGGQNMREMYFNLDYDPVQGDLSLWVPLVRILSAWKVTLSINVPAERKTAWVTQLQAIMKSESGWNRYLKIVSESAGEKSSDWSKVAAVGSFTGTDPLLKTAAQSKWLLEALGPDEVVAALLTVLYKAAGEGYRNNQAERPRLAGIFESIYEKLTTRKLTAISA